MVFVHTLHFEIIKKQKQDSPPLFVSGTYCQHSKLSVDSTIKSVHCLEAFIEHSLQNSPTDSLLKLNEQHTHSYTERQNL